MNQIHIITADKEKEFSLHEKIASKFNEFIYVAKLYHSWKKKPTKNTNGWIRQYFPKDTKLGDITQEQEIRVQNILNFRARKRLGYIPPEKI